MKVKDMCIKMYISVLFLCCLHCLFFYCEPCLFIYLLGGGLYLQCYRACTFALLLVQFLGFGTANPRAILFAFMCERVCGMVDTCGMQLAELKKVAPWEGRMERGGKQDSKGLRQLPPEIGASWITHTTPHSVLQTTVYLLSSNNPEVKY